MSPRAVTPDEAREAAEREARDAAQLAAVEAYAAAHGLVRGERYDITVRHSRWSWDAKAYVEARRTMRGVRYHGPTSVGLSIGYDADPVRGIWHDSHRYAAPVDILEIRPAR